MLETCFWQKYLNTAFKTPSTVMLEQVKTVVHDFHLKCEYDRVDFFANQRDDCVELSVAGTACRHQAVYFTTKALVCRI